MGFKFYYSIFDMFNIEIVQIVLQYFFIVGQNVIKPLRCTTYPLVIPSKPIDAKDGANANITTNFSLVV
jgi:hypothetical protein